MFTSGDLVLILLLVFLEGILSIDNALVLALLAKGLPKEQRRKALTYGLVGAIGFRFLALGLISQLLRWHWVKFVGGAYLLFIAAQHFIPKKKEAEKPTQSSRHFWKTILAIELTDIAFALDSILAAVALTPKFWVIFTGGVLGIVIMRFAASGFINVLEKFPAFEDTAYHLIFLIGVKVILEGLELSYLNFHSPQAPAFLIFWGTMLITILFGFKKKSK